MSRAARTVIEQAKGVISAQTGLDMADAFERLRAMAAERGKLLAQLARETIEMASRPSA